MNGVKLRLKLVVFDVDGTLLRVRSSWRYLHERLNTWNKGQEYARQFFHGLITYEDWARFDALLWKGIPLSRIQKIVDKIPYTRGAHHVMKTLQQNGFKIILLSAGLSIITNRIVEELGADEAIANELVAENGILTGEVRVRVSFHNKDRVLEKLLPKFGAEIEECIAIGDDETMIPLFKRVGLAIAFNPQTHRVEKHAHITIKNNNLREILPHILQHSSKG